MMYSIPGSSVHFEDTSIGNPEQGVTGHPSIPVRECLDQIRCLAFGSAATPAYAFEFSNYCNSTFSRPLKSPEPNLSGNASRNSDGTDFAIHARPAFAV
jgi:hypothetical protein